MNTTDVRGTLHEMWETRPARPRDDRQIAGVASAIARRYDIDPVLVRVGFVVAAFSGIGAALYIAGWAVLPDEPGDSATPRRSHSPRGIVVVGLVFAAMLSVGSIFGSRGALVLPALATLALLFLLHRSRGDRSTAVPAATVADAGAAAATAAAAGPSLVKEPATPEPSAPSPPAWDPLGAAPFAWDLPEPSPVTPPPTPRRRRPPVTSVTFGLALLAGGITAVVLLLAGALTLANLPLLFGVVLAVLGCGLVVGAFAHAGRGLIPLAVIVGVLTWGLVAAPLDRWQGDGVGELRATPVTATAVLPTYERAAGQIDLDLRAVDLSVPTNGDASAVHTQINLGAGDVQVYLPPNADVRLTASAGIGRVAFGDREEAGPGAEIDVTEDLGADNQKAGRLLVLDIEAGAGNVEVHRG